MENDEGSSLPNLRSAAALAASLGESDSLSNVSLSSELLSESESDRLLMLEPERVKAAGGRKAVSDTSGFCTGTLD